MGFPTTPDEILVTVGVSEGFDLACRTILCPGDEVLIPEPSYVSYAPVGVMAGAKPVFIKTSAENGFQVSPMVVEKAVTPKTKALILCNNNPTGATLDRQHLLEIAEVVKAHDLILISDEIYGRLTYVGAYLCAVLARYA